MTKTFASFAVLVVLTCPTISGAEEPAESLVLQWALLHGARGSSELAAPGRDVDDRAGKELLEWDFRRDDQELIELFQLATIETLQQGKNLFSSNGSSVSIRAGEGEQQVDVDVALSIRSMSHEGNTLQVVRAEFVIQRRGEVLSAPTIMTELGKRAIVTSLEPKSQDLLYLVLQVDPAGNPSPDSSSQAASGKNTPF